MKLVSYFLTRNLLFFIGTISSLVCNAQTDVKEYDTFVDTLLIISDVVLDKDKLLIDRQFLLDSDTIKINQKGLTVEGFSVSAIALGQSVSLDTKNPYLSESMKSDIIDEQNRFKFIYLKDIILTTKDGRKLSPSTKSIKIVFIN